MQIQIHVNTCKSYLQPHGLNIAMIPKEQMGHPFKQKWVTKYKPSEN